MSLQTYVYTRTHCSSILITIRRDYTKASLAHSVACLAHFGANSLHFRDLSSIDPAEQGMQQHELSTARTH